VSDAGASLEDAVTRLEQIAAALAAGGERDEEMAALAQEAVQVSETITRMLPRALEQEEST
jgi:hypothetical protein